MKKLNPALIGLFQALATLIYCALITGLMILMDKSDITPPGFLSLLLMLFLLVFSAAICGTLVFGYPIYLMHNKKIKPALAVLGYTFLYLLLGIAVILIIIFSR